MTALAHLDDLQQQGADLTAAAVALGRKGGKVKSRRKALSSAKNGKKGGRPRKGAKEPSRG